ncbi:MAG: MBL fold metallo-hydrolase [Vicinamibacterales bacterium]
MDRTQFTGGNVSVFVTDAGVTVVDSKLAGYGPDMHCAIKAVTSKPITTLINTHTHGDHTGSNEAFPASVNIVAHENTKALMAKMDAFKGEKAAFLPKQTYKDRLTLGSGKDRIELYYFGKGHTSGDTMVYFPTLKDPRDGRSVGVEGRAAHRSRERGERPPVAGDAEESARHGQGRRHDHSRPHAGVEAGGAPGVPALHGGPRRRNAGRGQCRQVGRRCVRAEHGHGEVPAGYKSDRLKAAIEAIYKEMGK